MPSVIKDLIREAMTCDPNHVVTQDDLNKLEKHLESVWKRLNTDITFTKHFLDRVNDSRNGRQITLCELARIFLETFRQYGQKLVHITKSQWEAVLTDKTTNVNVPFILKHNGKDLEIVAKTIMRKPDFKTPDTKLVVAHRGHGDDMTKTLKEWSGFGMPQSAPVAGPVAVDDVNVNAYRVEDPEVLSMLNGFLSSLTKKPFINPYYPVQQAAGKLQSVGLSFPLRGVNLGGDSGCVYLPVSQFGGRVGWDLDGSWLNDDGISNRVPGGISLKVSYSSNNGEYSVGMQLVNASEAPGMAFGEAAPTSVYPYAPDHAADQDDETLFDSFAKFGNRLVENQMLSIMLLPGKKYTHFDALKIKTKLKPKFDDEKGQAIIYYRGSKADLEAIRSQAATDIGYKTVDKIKLYDKDLFAQFDEK